MSHSLRMMFSKEDPPLTKEQATEVLTKVITELSIEQKNNLLTNIDLGRTVCCGERAYLFCDVDSGCLLTLANTTNIPKDRSKLKALDDIQEMIRPFYKEVKQKYGWNYYWATTVLDSMTIIDIINKCLR